MRLTIILPSIVALAGLAACAPRDIPAPATGPVATDAPRASPQMPQSPNSLPSNDRVNAPITPSVGQVGTTGTPTRRY